MRRLYKKNKCPPSPHLKEKEIQQSSILGNSIANPVHFLKDPTFTNHIFVLLTESDQKIWSEFWLRNSVKTFANVRIRSSKKIDQPKKFRIRMWKFACNKNRKKYKATIIYSSYATPPPSKACMLGKRTVISIFRWPRP